MILNNIDVEIKASIELVDAYNNNFPEDFTYKSVIYCVHNKVNNKNYIGQTKDFKSRFSDSFVGHFKSYKKYLEGTLGWSGLLYSSWVKYGLESFTVYIIEECETREILNDREMYWIKTLHTCVEDSECFGYNLTWGADRPGYNFYKPETIQKSLETRTSLYGSPVARCLTPESREKIRQTQLKRYGKSGFINTNTPEAIEKAKQTKLQKYGNTLGPANSKRVREKVKKTKLEKYGNVFGKDIQKIREKNVRNSHKSRLFNQIFSIINLSKSSVIDLREYVFCAYEKFSGDGSIRRHINRVISFLPTLKEDPRWTSDLDNIFSDLDSFNLRLDQAVNDHKKFILNKLYNETTIKEKRFFKNFLNRLEKIQGEVTWESYKTLIKTTYRGKKQKHFNMLIDYLPTLKTLPGWTPEMEKAFGHLTKEDI